jgi:hypothetical protein
MKKYILLPMICLILGGCGSESRKQEGQPIYQSGRVQRHIDTEAGVACWVYTAAYRGGIDCMPMENTKLDTEAGLAVPPERRKDVNHE